MDLDKIKKISFKLNAYSASDRRNALLAIADRVTQNQSEIILQNQRDLAEAEQNKLSAALIDRLTLNEKRIEQLVQGIIEIADAEDVLGEIVSEQVRGDGLKIQKQRIPLGVILMIFESRPDVVISASALAIKSANAIILKGGKEAKHTNKVLAELLCEAMQNYLPTEAVTLLDSQNREQIQELIQDPEHIDLVIPRGGEGLIRYIYENSRVPVIAHYKGLCHLYLDQGCQDLGKALSIILNAKLSRPGVCNALETLLVHQSQAANFMPVLLNKLQEQECAYRLCPKGLELFPDAEPATADDWSTEYLDRVLSVKIVESIEEAVEHIQKYGSLHTEGIISDDTSAINYFTANVIASCVAVNSSTRFNDGGELGLGAEIGISTSKLHAFGPMGVKELTTTRFLVTGDGHIRN